MEATLKSLMAVVQVGVSDENGAIVLKITSDVGYVVGHLGMDREGETSILLLPSGDNA